MSRWNRHLSARQPINRFKTPIHAAAGDRVRVTCEWDNSREHQPTVDGVRMEPRDVRFGEKSTDEMCIGTLALTSL
jgi:hypothetical protein